MKLTKRIDKAVDKTTKIGGSYFQEARSWHDDIYTRVIIDRNRFKLASITLVGLLFMALLCIVLMLPLQKIELVVVHQNADGYTWVTTTKANEQFTHSQVQVESELAHYVTLRESYDTNSYVVQGKLVKYFSSEDVESQYLQYQQDANSPVHQLNHQATRSILIQGIELLSAAQTQGISHLSNTAFVNFVAVDTSAGGMVTKTPYQALISWTWQGEPNDQEAKWQNFDGFTVTEYHVNPVNVSNN